MSIEDITVIITSFKSNDKIINCLKSINNQCKVIVVENSNDTKIKQMIESQFNNVNCFLSGANLGYGRANNLGLKNVKTKYALILNPDATLEKSALENFLILVGF